MTHLGGKNRLSAEPFKVQQSNFWLDMQATFLEQSTWLDNMYVRVAEVTAQSELQFKMLMAFIEKELLPRNIAAGQLVEKFSNIYKFMLCGFKIYLKVWGWQDHVNYESWIEWDERVK